MLSRIDSMNDGPRRTLKVASSSAGCSRRYRRRHLELGALDEVLDQLGEPERPT